MKMVLYATQQAIGSLYARWVTNGITWILLTKVDLKLLAISIWVRFCCRSKRMATQSSWWRENIHQQIKAYSQIPRSTRSGSVYQKLTCCMLREWRIRIISSMWVVQMSAILSVLYRPVCKRLLKNNSNSHNSLNSQNSHTKWKMNNPQMRSLMSKKTKNNLKHNKDRVTI